MKNEMTRLSLFLKTIYKCIVIPKIFRQGFSFKLVPELDKLTAKVILAKDK